jgi:hypothetical protein
LTIGHIQIDYKFAGSADASVHFGFALGTLLLLKDPQNGLLVHLADKVSQGSAIFIFDETFGGRKRGAYRWRMKQIFSSRPARRINRAVDASLALSAEPANVCL